MPLHIDMRKERTITVIRAVGTLLHQDGAFELRECLLRCMGAGDSNLLLEAHGISGMDESGVQALHESRAEAKQSGGDLKISGPRYWFLAAMALYASQSSFPYYADSEDALASFVTGASGEPRGVRHFDILEFVKEQEAEEEQKSTKGSEDQTNEDR